MHELVVYVFFAGIVGHCREPCEAIFVHKRLQRIEGRHCDVGSHVPLEAAKQVRIANILLDDGQFTIVDCTNIINHMLGTLGLDGLALPPSRSPFSSAIRVKHSMKAQYLKASGCIVSKCVKHVIIAK